MKNSAKLLLTLNEGVGVVVPFNAKLGIIGDSIAGQWVFNSADDYRMGYTHGFPTWAQAFSGGRYAHPVGACLSYSGQKAVDILVDARIDALIATGCAAVIIQPGINDITAGDAAAGIIAARAYAVARFRAAGLLVFNATVTKLFSPATLSAPKEAVRQEVNTAIRAQAGYGVVTLDLDQYITASNQVVADGIHPNPRGAYDSGKGVAAVLGSRVGAGDPTALLSSQPYYGVNLALAGSGGSLGGGASGQVANSHTLTDASAGGATVAGSKAGDGKQLITVSGSYTGDQRNVQLYHSISSGQLPAALETIECMLDMELLADPVNIASITVSTTVYTAGFALVLGRVSTSTSIGLTNPVLPMVAADGRRVFRSPQIKLAAGTPAIVSSFVYIYLADGGSSTSVAAQLKLHGFGAIKAA